MFSKRIQQVVRLKDGWEVVDLNYMAKLFRIEVDVEALVQSVVVLGVLNGDVPWLLQVGLDLTAWTQKKCGKRKKKKNQIQDQNTAERNKMCLTIKYNNQFVHI